MEVINLCRDSQNQGRDTQKYSEIQHIISANTPYLDIMDSLFNHEANIDIEKSYYVNNNIRETNSYLNTSIDSYNDGKLPYNSELVFPIINLKAKNKNEYNFGGFLCIDSDGTNVFRHLKYDLVVIKSIIESTNLLISKLNS